MLRHENGEMHEQNFHAVLKQFKVAPLSQSRQSHFTLNRGTVILSDHVSADVSSLRMLLNTGHRMSVPWSPTMSNISDVTPEGSKVLSLFMQRIASDTS